jgi:predicted secreted protein
VTSSRSECWDFPVDVETARAVSDAVARAAEESTDFSSGRLNDLGWEDLLADDVESATRAYFEAQGRWLIASTALDSVVLAAIDGPWTWPDTRVVYPWPGSRATGSVVEGVVFAREPFTTCLVPLLTPDGVLLHVVQAEDATIEAVDGLDATNGFARFTAPAASATVADAESAGRWDRGLIAARRALSHELIGVCNQMMRIAVEHVSVRHQFGRPLGANQAVQHRLADAQVDIAAAETVADESWKTVTRLTAVAAKALADQAFATMAKHGQQVLGGIGYTWEHEWRHFARRGMVLSALLGSTDECEREVAGHLVADGVVRIGGLV